MEEGSGSGLSARAILRTGAEEYKFGSGIIFHASKEKAKRWRHIGASLPGYAATGVGASGMLFVGNDFPEDTIESVFGDAEAVGDCDVVGGSEAIRGGMAIEGVLFAIEGEACP